MAGRPRKPTSLKLVTGNPGKRATNKQEPDPSYLQDLTPPEYLSKGAAQVWNELAPELRNARLLTVLDVHLLAPTCEAIAQHRAAVKKIGENAIIAKPVMKDGQEVGETEQINPWLLVQSMAFKRLFAGLREFGMSPAARTRIALQPQGELFGDNQKAASYFT